MSAEVERSLPITTFYSNKKIKKYKLKYHEKQLIYENSPNGPKKIPITEVIAVQSQNKSTRFTIQYAERKSKNKLEMKILSLNHSDALQVSTWVTTLQNQLKTVFQRPKRLLLFVNPYGGTREALKIYEKLCKPLFIIAQINVTVIVTEKKNHIHDLLIHYDMEPYDSVGCVGGDGTVSELINGLVLRECRLRGIDHNDPSQTLPKPSTPVAIIPAGSTNTTAYCLYGTTDVQTAVLNVMLGHQLGLDLVSVHDDDHLLRLYADVISYGYLGDIAHYSDELRWMGTSRYEYVGFKRIIANAGYEGEISMLIDASEDNQIKCYENCDECALKQQKQMEINEGSNWKKIEGTFFMVSGANISCAGERNPNGLAPYSHLGDGYLHLVIIRHTSIFDNIKTLQRLLKENYSFDDLSHVEVYRAREFRFCAQGTPGRWNCDGEVIHHTDIHARVHCQLITVFGCGIPKQKHSQMCGI